LTDIHTAHTVRAVEVRPVADEVLKRWGRNVAKAREGNLTQEGLAAATKSSQATISRIELGKQQPTLDLALAIAAALDTTHDRLFSVDQPEAVA
jgi:transcriptional regulator with XRE-family HTH domain